MSFGFVYRLFPLETALGLFFVQAAVIISIIRSLSLTFRFLNQPQVIFEICGGILLGPSGIGRWDLFLSTIFPSSSLVYLELVANIGLVLYIFLVGLEIDSNLLRKNFKTTFYVAGFGLLLPFGAGIVISIVLYHYVLIKEEAFANVTLLSFSLFIGTSISVTAIGVMARILKEKKLFSSEAAVISVGAAIIDETLAWILLILSVSLASSSNYLSALIVFVRISTFACVMYWVVAPLFKALVDYVESADRVMSTVVRPALWVHEHLFAFTMLIILLTSWITEFLGVHAIFGAFMVGLLIESESRLAHNCRMRMESFVTTFMLPLYFAISGLQTDITQIESFEMILMVIFVVIVSTLGKYLGCGLPAWLCGLSFRNTAMVAVLMNTRGIFELIVLNVGVKAGIISTRVFTIMVLMTLITTFMTSPLIDYLYPSTRECKNSLALGCSLDEEEEEMRSVIRGLILMPHVTSDWSMRDIKINVLCDEISIVDDILPLLFVVFPTFAPSRAVITVLHLTQTRSLPEVVAVPIGDFPLQESALQNIQTEEKSPNGTEDINEIYDRVTSFCSLFDVHIRFIDEFSDPSNPPQHARVTLNSPNITIVLDTPRNPSILVSFSQIIVTSPTPVLLLRKKNDIPVDSTHAIRSILVVISGCSTDVHVIGLCQYIAYHHPNITINICVMLETPTDCCCSSRFPMNSTVWSMLRNLKKLIEERSLPNVVLRHMYFMSILSTYSMLKDLKVEYDAAICSFIKNPTAGSKVFRRNRSVSSERPPWMMAHSIERLESGTLDDSGETKDDDNCTIGVVGSALEKLMLQDADSKHGKVLMVVYSPYLHNN